MEILSYFNILLIALKTKKEKKKPAKLNKYVRIKLARSFFIILICGGNKTSLISFIINHVLDKMNTIYVCVW